VAFISILELIVPAGLLAADETVATSTTTAAGANATQSGTAFAATKEEQGSLNRLEGNNAGGQNTLSPDHTPGTTGTSGQ
jgi:hypothetical protein